MDALKVQREIVGTGEGDGRVAGGTLELHQGSFVSVSLVTVPVALVFEGFAALAAGVEFAGLVFLKRQDVRILKHQDTPG